VITTIDETRENRHRGILFVWSKKGDERSMRVIDEERTQDRNFGCRRLVTPDQSILLTDLAERQKGDRYFLGPSENRTATYTQVIVEVHHTVSIGRFFKFHASCRISTPTNLNLSTGSLPTFYVRSAYTRRCCLAAPAINKLWHGFRN